MQRPLMSPLYTATLINHDLHSISSIAVNVSVVRKPEWMTPTANTCDL